MISQAFHGSIVVCIVVVCMVVVCTVVVCIVGICIVGICIAVGIVVGIGMERHTCMMPLTG